MVICLQELEKIEKKMMVVYKCEWSGCEETFETYQGSQRRYCAKHIALSVTAGKRIDKESEKKES